MNKKMARFLKIKDFLRKKGKEMTVTEICEHISEQAGAKISRKTIQRDMDELVNSHQVIQINKFPLHFKIKEKRLCKIQLSQDEINTILKSLKNKPQLLKKIREQI